MEMNRPPRVQRLTRVPGEIGETRVPEEDLILQDMANAIMPTVPDPNPRLLKTVAAAVVVGIAVLLLLIILRVLFVRPFSEGHTSLIVADSVLVWRTTAHGSRRNGGSVKWSTDFRREHLHSRPGVSQRPEIGEPA